MALSKGVAVQDVHVLELQAELIKAKQRIRVNVTNGNWHVRRKCHAVPP